MARVAALAGHEIVASRWAPVAFLWQDSATLLVYAAIDRALLRVPRVRWAVYAVFVGYVAIGVPATRVLSTPMTWTMWRAAGGALSDSIWQYVTAANLLWIAGVLVAAIAAPRVASGFLTAAALARAVSRINIATISLAIFAILGPFAVARVDTRGLDRNAWSALVMSALPRTADVKRTADTGGARNWRAGLHGLSSNTDLSRFRAAAADQNVILVSLESTAAQYLALYGANEDAMPNLSALARSAIVFDNAYAVYPESIKGLFSILCSNYPASAANTYEDVPCRSIASHLADHGFHTGLFHSGRFGYLGMDALVRNRGFSVLADAGDIGGHHESSFGVDDRTTVARLLGWIDTLPRGDRFFAAYLPIAGHHPYESPEPGPLPARDEFGRYRNALRYADTALADLVSGIASRGLHEHTVWIVFGDHGEAFGQHDGNFGHTFQLYEENVHVPFMIAAPGLRGLTPLEPRLHWGQTPWVRNAGEIEGVGSDPDPMLRAHQPVSLIDTAPTILDLLGLPADPTYEGTSALASDARMALFFTEYSLNLVGLRDGNLKYTHDLDSGRSRLFDLDRDPLEAHDIAADHTDDIRWYRQRVRSWTGVLRSR